MRGTHPHSQHRLAFENWGALLGLSAEIGVSRPVQKLCSTQPFLFASLLVSVFALRTAVRGCRPRAALSEQREGQERKSGCASSCHLAQPLNPLLGFSRRLPVFGQRNPCCLQALSAFSVLRCGHWWASDMFGDRHHSIFRLRDCVVFSRRLSFHNQIEVTVVIPVVKTSFTPLLHFKRKNVIFNVA